MDADTFFVVWIGLILFVLWIALSLPGGDEH